MDRTVVRQEEVVGQEKESLKMVVRQEEVVRQESEEVVAVVEDLVGLAVEDWGLALRNHGNDCIVLHLLKTGRPSVVVLHLLLLGGGETALLRHQNLRHSRYRTTRTRLHRPHISSRS